MLSKEKPYICTLKKADPVAQLVEQYTFNVWALGSNPSGITKETYFQKEMGFLFLMTFKMHFDKLERNKKPKNYIAQFGFYAWIEPKKCVHGILLSAFFLF